MNMTLRMQLERDEDGQPIELTAEQFDLSKHNGMITISNPSTGNHRTFKISTVQEGDLKGKRIVSLLIGPEREAHSNWKGFGFVVENNDRDAMLSSLTARVAVWKRCRGSEFEKLGRLLEQPIHYAQKHGLEYLIEARCQRCNRALTVPESIKTGLGPVCAGRE